MVQYADDINTWSASWSLVLAAKHLNAQLTRIYKWCNRWRVDINADKSQSVIFSKTAKKNTPVVTVEWNGEEIPQSNEVVFLGVRLSKNLSWAPHVEWVRTRCSARIHAFARLAKRCSRVTMVTLYKSCVRSVLEYAAPAWVPGATTSMLDRLQVVQNRFLRLISGSHRRTRVENLHTLCEIDRLDSRLQQLC